jgi:hypothetical protein
VWVARAGCWAMLGARPNRDEEFAKNPGADGWVVTLPRRTLAVAKHL